jgi:hypothetical protein
MLGDSKHGSPGTGDVVADWDDYIATLDKMGYSDVIDARDERCDLRAHIRLTTTQTVKRRPSLVALFPLRPKAPHAQPPLPMLDGPKAGQRRSMRTDAEGCV